MKFAIWIHTVAITLASVAVASFRGIFESIYSPVLAGRPIPALSALLLFDAWFLLIPLPWLVAAIWLGRKKTSPQNLCLVFLGASVLFLVLLLAFAILGFSALIYTLTIGYGSPILQP